MVENDVLISEFAFMGLENLDEEIIIKCNSKIGVLYNFYNRLNLGRYRNRWSL